jgi:hypothetical protein
MKFTFCTVCHDKDIDFLILQARSMDIYLKPKQVEQIIVIKNGPITEQAEDIIKNSYGRHKRLVRFVDGKKIATIPANVSGWYSQQVLKLIVSLMVNTEYYVLLDAKNHLIFPIKNDFFVRNGKARAYITTYPLTHPLTSHFDKTLTYFGLNPDKYRERFLPPVTPYVIKTEIARRLVKAIEQRENQDFPTAFLKLRITEFFSLNAFILTSGYSLDEVYDLSGSECPIIWSHYASNPELIIKMISKAEKKATPFFSVHRGALPLLNEKSRGVIASFWKRRKLFEYTVNGLRYLYNTEEDSK